MPKFSDALYPGDDFMVANPPSNERRDEESDMGETPFHGFRLL
jgi:hypothetical protein